MPLDVNRLLKKKGWTGEETGKALILDLVNSYQQTLAGSRDPKPLFPPEKITTMLHNLHGSREDIEAYNRYVNLHSWILQYQAVANAHLQRFQSCLHELIAVHNAAESAENEYRYIEQLPRIMTLKQYEELKAKRIEEQLDPDGDGTDAIGDNLFSLIIRAIEYYGRELEANPKRPNPLKAVKKAYAKKPIKDKAIIDAYNHLPGMEIGVLPDGTRGDSVTREEWAERVKHYSPDIQRLEAEAKEGYSGQPGSLAYERISKEARAAHMGEPAPEEGFSPIHWTYPEEAPSKWDVIAACLDDADFMDFFPCLGGEGTPEEYTAQATAFKKEFSELVEAVLKALDAIGYTYGDDARPLSSIPVEEWETTVISWRELYNADFPGFRKEIESDFSIFDGDKRALINGVAILRPSDFYKRGEQRYYSASIDENGHFIEPKATDLFSNMFGLEAYTPANPESGENILRIEQTRQSLEESLRFLIGYDLALELLADETGIEGFTIFKANSANSLERTKAVNSLFDLLYTHIEAIEYRDKERKAEKLKALREVFYPLKTDELAVTDRRRKEAVEMLKGLKAFEGNKGRVSPGWNLIALLTLEEGGAEE